MKEKHVFVVASPLSLSHSGRRGTNGKRQNVVPFFRKGNFPRKKGAAVVHTDRHMGRGLGQVEIDKSRANEVGREEKQGR